MAWYNNSHYTDSYQVLIGSLLGDGSVLTNRKKSTSAHYEETHSLKQKQYLLWKNEFFKKILNTKFTESAIYHKINNKTYYRARILSKTHPYLLDLRKLFYPNGLKKVNWQILNALDVLGLAVWYCDDGCYNYRNRNVSISTQGFSLSENQIIKEYFLKRWNLKINILQDYYKKYFLNFNRENAYNFLCLIHNAVPACMSYKLGELHSSNKRRLELAKYKQNHEKRLYRLNNREKYLAYHREYRNRPDIKAKIQKKRDENKDRNRSYYKEYYNINQDKIWQSRRDRKDEIREQHKRCYEKHKEKYLKQKHEYYQKNREPILEKQKVYAQSNKSKIKAYNRQYFQANKKRLLEYSKAYRKSKRG